MTTKVLGISGSLRTNSFNTGLLRAAQVLAEGLMEIDIADLAGIPPYNEDVFKAGFPGPVERLRAQIRAADGLLIATPEYNYSIPGVLKNAIDWASRPPEQPFMGKPIAIMGASVGGFGTVRAQLHLRQVFIFLDGRVLARPEVMVSSVAAKADASGTVIDAATREMIGAELRAFANWIGTISPAPQPTVV